MASRDFVEENLVNVGIVEKRNRRGPSRPIG
jgi:hypothetical protein